MCEGVPVLMGRRPRAKMRGVLFFFFLMIGRPPISPLFPYTTLFRSVFNLLLVHKDLAGKNQSLRFLASVREPSFDQEAIQPELCWFHEIELNDGGIAALSA